MSQELVGNVLFIFKKGPFYIFM